jgi:hypothetical protein
MIGQRSRSYRLLPLGSAAGVQLALRALAALGRAVEFTERALARLESNGRVRAGVKAQPGTLP